MLVWVMEFVVFVLLALAAPLIELNALVARLAMSVAIRVKEKNHVLLDTFHCKEITLLVLHVLLVHIVPLPLTHLSPVLSELTQVIGQQPVQNVLLDLNV